MWKARKDLALTPTLWMYKHKYMTQLNLKLQKFRKKDNISNCIKL